MRSSSLMLALALATLLASSPGALAMTDEESHDPRNLSWIQPHAFALGGGGLEREDLAYLASQGFGAIVDVRQEHDDGADAVRAAGMDYLYVPVRTASEITEPQLEQVVAWSDREIAAGKVVYVHCSNGWHRAPTFAMAWLMHHEHLTFDQAKVRVEAAREGVIVRAPGPLLAYQAKLEGRAGLTVQVSPDHVHPSVGDRVSLTIHVLLRDAPVAGARVRVWTEEPSFDTTVTTDASGAVTVILPVESYDSGLVEHLFARASAPDGSAVDGAANLELPVHVAPAGSWQGAPTWIAGAAFGAILLAVAGTWIIKRRASQRGAATRSR